MLRPRVLHGVFALLALLAVTAMSQIPVPSYPTPPPPGYPPTVPAPPSAIPEPAPKPMGVDDILDKLEALKARREAIEQEEKATHALLKERLKAQQERVGKLGGSVTAPPPPPLPPPSPAPLSPPSY